MTGRFASRPMTIHLLVTTLVLGTGCSHSIELAVPANVIPPVSATVVTDARVPLLIQTLQVTENGAAIAPPAPLERQVLGAIASTRLFSQQYQSGQHQPATDQPRVTVRLSVSNLVEPHTGQAAWRDVVVASLFTLAPFLSLEYDYGTAMGLEIERWDGQIKHYNGSSNGSAYHTLFGATPAVIEELKGQVTEACLSSLLNQVVRDWAFYLASHEQPHDRPIQTVTVGIRRPASRAIPISRPLADTSPW